MTRLSSRAGLVLSADQAELLMAHARAEMPREACALLGGERTTGVATSVHLTRNSLASPLRFEVDPQDLVRVVLALDAAGTSVLAIFHSHTRSPAVPSPADIHEAHYAAIHLIASMSEPGQPLRAWQIDGGIAREIQLTISAGALSPTRVG